MAQVTLTEFLLARIAEDEAVARWGRLVDDPSDPDSATKILRWDHARLIAECEAKRAVIAFANTSTEYASGAALHQFRRILWALAQPYADHPDYLPEWKP